LEQDQTKRLGIKARLFYDCLTRAAGPPGRLTSTGRALAATVGCAYSLCVTYLRELEEAGWLNRVRHKHGDTEYILTRPVQATHTPEQATSQHAHEQSISQHMGDPSHPIIEAQQHAIDLNTTQVGHRAGGSGVPGASQEGDQAQHPQDELPQSSDDEMNSENVKVQNGTSSSGDSHSPSDLCSNLNFENLQSSDFVISGKNSGLKVQSSEFKVQSSANAYVPPVRTVLIKQQHAAAKMNFEDSQSSDSPAQSGHAGEGGAAPAGDLTLAQKAELKIIAAQFHKRLLQLLSEYNITGKKRADLAAQICKLVADNLHPERYEHVLADVKAGLEQAKKRKDAGLVQNAEAVGVRILMDYVATGQLTLFKLPAPEAKTTSRGRAQGRTFRREQTPRHQGLPTEIAAMRRNAEQARLRGEYDKAEKWLQSAAKAEARLAAQHANP
jgi:hypothetical protein